MRGHLPLQLGRAVSPFTFAALAGLYLVWGVSSWLPLGFVAFCVHWIFCFFRCWWPVTRGM